MLSLDDYARACRELVVLDNGEPLELEPFQRDIISDLLSGVRELHIRIPEENGKTTLLAAISLIHLLSTREPHAVIAARNKDQANILYNQAVKMVQGSAALSSRLRVLDGFREIRVKGKKGGVGLKVIPADELSAHGAINTLVVIDEMHALPDLGLYRVLSGKLGKRAGAQLLAISTAGEPDSEYEQMWEGILTSSPVIAKRGDRVTRCEGPQHVAWCWGLVKDDDPQDLGLVKLANPASWITTETLKAKRDLPGWELKHWLQVVCNVPTRDLESRFLLEGDWDAADISQDCPSIPEGVSIIAGVDIGFADDATAIVPAWYDMDGLLLLGEAVVLQPPRNGTSLRPQDMVAALRELDARNPIECIAHDAAGIGGPMTAILEEAFPDIDILPISAADSNSGPVWFNEQLAAEKLKHTGGPILRRHLLNAIRVSIKDDPERFRIMRPKKSRHNPGQRPMREIDAAWAAIFAVWGSIGREPTLDPGLYAQVF